MSPKKQYLGFGSIFNFRVFFSFFLSTGIYLQGHMLVMFDRPIEKKKNTLVYKVSVEIVVCIFVG